MLNKNPLLALFNAFFMKYKSEQLQLTENATFMWIIKEMKHSLEEWTAEKKETPSSGRMEMRVDEVYLREKENKERINKMRSNIKHAVINNNNQLNTKF